MISNNFLCDDKDVINQLTEEQLKLTKMQIEIFKLGKYQVDGVLPSSSHTE